MQYDMPQDPQDNDIATLTNKTSPPEVRFFLLLPLHDNTSELGMRVQARIRDINSQTVSQYGTKSKDTFATSTILYRNNSACSRARLGFSPSSVVGTYPAMMTGYI